jgi:hypothetical protein
LNRPPQPPPVTPLPLTVHILDGGWPLCGFSGVMPGDWPEGHYWVSAHEPPELKRADCAECLRRFNARDTRNAALWKEAT